MHAPLTATLPAHSELRFHVGADKPGTVKLISGNAELFGVELAPGKEYLLPQDKNGSIATFYGASVRLDVIVGGSTYQTVSF
jgi:polyribonucleotide 5'-hydroxyl-kinase